MKHEIALQSERFKLTQSATVSAAKDRYKLTLYCTAWGKRAKAPLNQRESKAHFV